MKPRAALFLAVLTTTAAARPAGWQALEVAAGRGERGPWQQNDSRYDYVDDPTVALDARGGAMVAWVDQARKDVFVRRFGPDGKPLANASNVSRTPETFSWLPRIARAGDSVYLLWQEIIFSGGSHGGDMLFARSQDGGATFSPPVNLSRSIGGDGKGRVSRDHWDNGSFDLAAGADGTLYAAWTDYEGALWLRVSADRGASFSTPRRIAGEAQHPARAPSLATGKEHTVYLAWTHGEERTADIHIARSTDGGARFSEARIVHRTAAFSDAPKLAMDEKGVLHLAYADGQRVVYSRSNDGARSFEPPRELSSGRAGFPSIKAANDSVYVLWERFPERKGRPRGLGFVVSQNGGATFAKPQALADAGAPNGSFQGLLMDKLAVNAKGDVAIVNSSLEDGKRSRVMLIRGRTPNSHRALSE